MKEDFQDYYIYRSNKFVIVMDEDTNERGFVFSDFLVEDTDISMAYRVFHSIPLSISDNVKAKYIKKIDLTETNITYDK